MKLTNVVVAALLSFGFGCGSAPAAAPASAPAGEAPATPTVAVTPDMGSPHIGDAAPDFELPDQNGAKVKLSSMRGSVVVLAFVTSWCPFSEAEQPHLAALADAYKGKNVHVIAIDFKEPDAGYKKYLSRTAMPLPVLYDPDGTTAAAFTPPKAQPNVKERDKVIVTSNLVIDPNGKIQFFTMVDTVNFDAKLVHVRRKVDALLAEGSAKL